MRRRYTIIETLGAGGMGTVYRARRQGPAGFSKEVAIKVAAAEFSEQHALEILSDEARALGVVRHRAIVQTDGLVRVSGMWALVMEYVEGCSLDRLAHGNTLPLRASLTLTSEVAGALHTAQFSTTPRGGGRLSLLHRDIKPSNVMLTAVGDVKILDFGIAMSSMGTHSSRLATTNEGSLAYMSPERLQSIEGPESDVYALGALLYELLIGTPFGRTVPNARAHATRLSQADAALMNSEASTCAGLGDLILRMLAYDPSERPTAREVERMCHEWAAVAPGTSLRDFAEVSVPRGMSDAQLGNHKPQPGTLAPGTVLEEDPEDVAGPLLTSWTPSTPSSGGLGMAVSATPAVAPIAIMRALLVQEDLDTVERVKRTYGPDTDALSDTDWLQDTSMMRYLAWFAAISLLVAFGLFVFVMTQAYGWAQ